MEDKFSTDRGRGGGNVQAVMRAMGSDGAAADEASLSRPPLTSCCAAQFLTGPDRCRSAAQGLATPLIREKTLKSVTRLRKGLPIMPYEEQLKLGLGPGR